MGRVVAATTGGLQNNVCFGVAELCFSLALESHPLEQTLDSLQSVYTALEMYLRLLRR